MKNIKLLQDELDKARDLLKESQNESRALKRVVWNILNYANLFLVLLDSNMNVRMSNWSLAHKLGFEDETGLVGKCWLDYIKPEEKDMIKNVYKTLSTDSPKAEEYKEFTNEIVLPDKELLVVKWFNIYINSELHFTLSLGVQKYIPTEETEDSVRSYYRDIVEKDKTFIKSIRETLLENSISDSC